ncbi:MAG: hypothetical protein ACK42C_04550 [Aquificaceae bacterium]|uniref:hypothetical protein n=1 Tax=Hydrogenobacter sp. Uz 6-8 TaxID=3384828 RepID=UPI0030A35F0D
MERLLLFTVAGLVLGSVFVEFTYRLAGKGHLLLYTLSLPIKLLLFALILYICYAFGSSTSLIFCISGFLPGFLVSILLRGFVKNGRPKGA